ncbi:MAG: hypothetical protein K2I92_01450, partial [Muribaculaceae bacterium]|nr:hypothetical protein [Muribaculaceae bacterium]
PPEVETRDERRRLDELFRLEERRFFDVVPEAFFLEEDVDFFFVVEAEDFFFVVEAADFFFVVPEDFFFVVAVVFALVDLFFLAAPASKGAATASISTITSVHTKARKLRAPSPEPPYAPFI